MAIKYLTVSDTRMYLAARGGENFRKRIIYEGGITTLMRLSKHCLYADIQQQTNQILDSLSLADWNAEL